MDLKEFKADCIAACEDLLVTKLQSAKTALDNAQEAANQEGRSTAGDKYDTARAMGHIDRDMYAGQLDQLMTWMKNWKQLDFKSKEIIQPGSLILTQDSLFFLTIGIGKITVSGKEVLVVSPISPIGKLLLNKMKGDIFSINNREITIQDVI